MIAQQLTASVRTRAIGVIINARAHANRHDPQRPHHLAGLARRRDEVAITRTLDDLDRACARLAEVRPSIVAVCGGDGTLHQTLTALIRSYADEPLPAIAILRGGAMNIVADSLGISGEPIDLMRALLAHRDGAPVEMFEHGLLRIDGRYGFLFGAGAIYEFLRAYYATGSPSRLTAARMLARGMVSALVRGRFAKSVCRPIHVDVIADGKAWPHDCFVAVCAATIEQIGFGLRLFRTCGERSDAFATLGIDATPIQLLRSIPRIWVGKPMREPAAVTDLARELVLAPVDPEVLGYTIDGDLYTCARRITIRRGPTIQIVRLALA